MSPAATSKKGKVVGVVRKPFQDLGIVRPDAPQVLKQAALDLYSPPGDGGCAAIMEDIARLGAVLGPDLDEHVYAGDPDGLDADNLTAGAVGSLLDLPFSRHRSLGLRRRCARESAGKGSSRRDVAPGLPERIRTSFRLRNLAQTTQ